MNSIKGLKQNDMNVDDNNLEQLDASYQKELDMQLLATATWGVSNAEQSFAELKHLLQKGANINAVTEFGDNLLVVLGCHTFTSEEFSSYVEYAIKAGVNVNTKNVYDRTAIFYGNHPDVLIKSGAYLNIKDVGGMTPLMYAVENCRSLRNIYINHKWMRNVVSLIDGGADVDTVDNEGRTSLMRVVSNTNASEHLVRILLEAGAKIGLKDDSYETVYNMNVARLKVSEDPSRKNIVQLLKTAQTYYQTADSRKATLSDGLYGVLAMFSKDITNLVTMYAEITIKDFLSEGKVD